MTHKYVLFMMIFLGLGLAACSAATAAPIVAPSSATSAPVVTSPVATANTADASTSVVLPSATPVSPAAPAADLPRTDSQGSVEFVVTPLNLSQRGETLDFDVAMNTHSVNLSWNLAAQSKLTTDTGMEVKGQGWPVGGGHHDSGTLSFPAKGVDGTPLLAGAKKLTLTIQNAGAPERTFVWDLAP